MAAADPAGVVVQADADVLLVLRHAVGRVPFEVLPDPFHGVEFRGIAGEPLDVKARMGQSELADCRPLVDSALVPQQDDVPGQVAQKSPEELGHVGSLEVILLEPDIQAHAVPAGRDGERSQRRDAIMLIAVANDRSLTPQAPSAAAGGYEQKPALIQEYEMGAKSSGLFLYAASGSASTERWRPRRAGWPGAREPGNSNRQPVDTSRCDRDDTRRQTPSGLPGLCGSFIFSFSQFSSTSLEFETDTSPKT